MRIHNTGRKSGKNRTAGDGAYCTLRLALIPWGGSLVYLIDICRRPRGKQELISVVIHSRKPEHMKELRQGGNGISLLLTKLEGFAALRAIALRVDVFRLIIIKNGALQN
jgi:hypothetical protein